MKSVALAVALSVGRSKQCRRISDNGSEIRAVQSGPALFTI